jgi:hypothetical protein
VTFVGKLIAIAKEKRHELAARQVPGLAAQDQQRPHRGHAARAADF